MPCIFAKYCTCVIKDSAQCMMLIWPNIHLGPTESFLLLWHISETVVTRWWNTANLCVKSTPGLHDQDLQCTYFWVIALLSKNTSIYLCACRRNLNNSRKLNISCKICQETLLSAQEGKQIILILVFLFVT